MSSNSSFSFICNNSMTWSAFVSNCMKLRVGVASSAFTAFTSMVFLLPPCLFILHLGYQKYQKSPSSSLSMSHSDFFTYNMVVTELIKTLGATLGLCGALAKVAELKYVSIFMLNIQLYGKISFQLLTCVERYVAVVHPITYMRLRNQRGTRIRNAVTICAWLICFMLAIADEMVNICFNSIMYLTLISSSVISITFFSVVVLCVLIRPGPRRGGGDKARVDPTKLRAFYTIVAILGGLLVVFVGDISISISDWFVILPINAECIIWMSRMWYSLPSSLFLPLLFLHRAGKLTCGQRKKPET